MIFKKVHGLHIVADLYECDFSFFKSKSKKEIKSKFSTIIAKNNLNELGNFYYFFLKNDSFTAVVSLAESHLAIHTWPEDKYVSLDIFVCNYLKNNKDNAYSLFKDLINIFSPQKVVKKNIVR